MARLDHPNLVQDLRGGRVGRAAVLLDGVRRGRRLADMLHGTPMSPEAAAELAETLARASQSAHDRGVVHRDLTPNNVLIAADGQPKIVDFGLSKLISGGAGQTATGDVLGTPSYMAPEQAGGRSKDVGPAADVYALGAILYEMLTGRPPFRAETPLDTLAQVAHDEPVAPGDSSRRCRATSRTICLKCLSKEPARRYASAAVLAEDLRRYLAGEPVRARPVGMHQPGRALGAAAAGRGRPAGPLRGGRAPRVRPGHVGRATRRAAQAGAEKAGREERRQTVAAEEARGREAAQRRSTRGSPPGSSATRRCGTASRATWAVACSGWRRACGSSPRTTSPSSGRSARTSRAGGDRPTPSRPCSGTPTASWRPSGAPTGDSS